MYRDRNPYFKEYRKFETPFLKKSISDIVINGKKLNLSKDRPHEYTIWKCNNVYKLYSFMNNSHSETLYIITKNSKIIYWCTSNIFAPASSAWHILTEVYHGYGEDHRRSSWTWKSVDDFDCLNNFWLNIDNKFVKSIHYLLTDYQKEMYNKTGSYYIDKKLISPEEAERLANQCYRHT